MIHINMANQITRGAKINRAGEAVDPLPAATEPLGFIVLIADDEPEPGWRDDWDGKVHTTLEAGRAAVKQARSKGYRAVLAAQYAMDGE